MNKQEKAKRDASPVRENTKPEIVVVFGQDGDILQIRYKLLANITEKDKDLLEASKTSVEKATKLLDSDGWSWPTIRGHVAGPISRLDDFFSRHKIVALHPRDLFE